MRRRVVVLTEIIAPYRIPVFNALAKHADVDLHVIFLAENDPTQRQWLVYKNEIRFRYQVLPSWRRRLGRHSLLLNSGMETALRRAAPEAILCGGYNYIVSWQALRWAKRNGVPFSLWVESNARDFRSGLAWIESLKSRFLGDCSGVVVPGKSAFEYVMSYGVAEEIISVAPNAVDTDFFAEGAEVARGNADACRQSLNLPARFFLFVGRLVPEKGVFDLVEAYGRLTPDLRREIGLVLVGDGQARAGLEQQAAAIRPGVIRVVGFAQREQLPAYYGLADIFVFPTHSDPWGLVVNEAMACGLPVICTDAAGCAADLVEDHWNGLVISPGDLNQLSSALNQLARDHNLRLRCGQRSRERILQYSPESCAEGLASAVLLRSVAA